MSLIKNLKANEENSVNIVNFFELVLTESKSKYIELFIKVLKNSIDEKYDSRVTEARNALLSLYPEKTEQINSFSVFNLVLYSYLFDALYDLKIDINILNKFIDYNERNLISNNDVTTYKTFDDIHKQVMLSEMKVEEKELEKSVVKIFENDEWLMLKPLTYQSSVKYGYGTKWCTAMENDKTYFQRYSNEGILIYFINKLNSNKIAVYNKLNDENGNKLSKADITFWDTIDKQVDSFTIGLPSVLIDELRNHFDKHSLTNYQVLKIMSKQNGFKIKDEDVYNVKTKLSMGGGIGNAGEIAMVDLRNNEPELEMVDTIREQPTDNTFNDISPF